MEEGKKICDVIIRGLKYDLWNIPSKIHGSNNTLWVKKEKDLFNDSTEWIPWIDIGTNRKCWEVSIKQGNSMKFNHNWDISGHISVSIKLNNNQVYEFGASKLEYAFNEAQNKIYKLENLPIKLDDYSTDVGRPIYYKGLACRIANRFDEGSMIVNPDCNDEDLGWWWDNFAEPWYDNNDYEWLEETKNFGEIKVDILSEQIYWYRNDRENKLNRIKRMLNVKEIKKGT